MKIMAIDPSGNFNEGKGTTGIAYFEDNKLIKTLDIKAKEYQSQMSYWWSVRAKVFKYKPDILVIESFELFADKGKELTGSEFETAQLIGILKSCAGVFPPRAKQVVMQKPSIKSRYPDELLIKKGIINKDNEYSPHIKDAIRHGLYYINFKQNKE